MLDPVKYGNEVVATGLAGEDVALRVNVADRKLLVKSAKVEYYKRTVSWGEK